MTDLPEPPEPPDFTAWFRDAFALHGPIPPVRRTTERWHLHRKQSRHRRRSR